MTWPRPVPLIGDTSSAADRARRPDDWAFPEPSRRALAAIMAARRDVRRFRPAAVPSDVLERVLSAGHSAPSVGHSQPWRFLVVTDPATRARAALLADRERLAQAAQLEPDAARRLLDLQLEGIREAPLGIVVCCDRRTPAAGVLGRATFADADLWSCACAIQNLWLSARAEGLGLGWVTLFRPADLAELLDLPDGVVTLGWLCLGWPDERPPDPGLERAGWSKRQPLHEVVLYERWPPAAAGAAPAPPPSMLKVPDQKTVVGVRDDADRLLTPLGSLGVLDRGIDRALAAWQGDSGRSSSGALILAGGRHPVTAHGVSAYPARVTEDVLAASRAGCSLAATTAQATGLTLLTEDAGSSTGDLVTSDALGRPQVDELVERGRQLGRSTAARTGLIALGEVGVGNTTVAAALAVGLLRCDAADAVGLGAGADSAMLTRKSLLVTRAVQRARQAYGGELHDPRCLLGALGGPEFALLTGVVLGAAEGRAVVVLDGLATSISALLAVELEPAAATFLLAGQRSRERAHGLVLARLGLEPLLDLRFRAGEGVGAALASQLLMTGISVRTRTATTS